MTQTNRRTKNFYMNKYQRQIIVLAFYPTLVTCISILILAKLFYKQLVNIIVYNSTASSIHFINQWGSLTTFIVWCLFVLVLIWGYSISQKMVGAFIRVLRELDTIIEGGERKHIAVRQKDDLASELLQRINILIDNLPKDKSKLQPKK